MTQRRTIVRDAVGLGLAVGSYGVSFGALSVAAGLSVAQTCVLSLAAFTGGSQFAYVGVIAGGGSPASAVGTALLLGSRNTLYGIRLGGLLQLRGWRRLLGAQGVIDETTAMAVAQPAGRPEAGRLAFRATAVAVFAAWNVATVVGALLGNVVGDPRRLGLDGAAPAAFLALLWPRLADPRSRVVALVGALVALLATVALPAGLATPAAAVAVLAVRAIPVPADVR